MFHLNIAFGEKDLGSFLNGIKTMQAEFKQFTLEKGQKQLISSGEMALKRPGNFYWKTINPSVQIIVVNDYQISIYDPDLSQMTRKKVRPEEADNPASLLSGSYEALQKSFNVVDVSTKNQESWFLLEPKNKNSNYQWIRLFFAAGTLTSIHFLNNLSQENEIDFTKIKINTDLSNSLFKLVAPKGTDVIEE